MSITTEEAARIARAYGMSFTDALALAAQADTVEEAQHIAIAFGGTAAERADEAYTIAHKQQEADKAAEHKAAAAYQAAHPKPPKPKREPVVPDLRDGMTDRERMQANQAAHEANVKAAADERSAEIDELTHDYYNWAAAGKPEK